MSARLLVSLSLLLATGCTDPGRVRPDRTMISTTAKPTLEAALGVPAPAVARDQDFVIHYDKAIAFYGAEAYPEAIAEFETAYAIKADPLLLYNIAQAYRKAGRAQDAIDHYQRFAQAAPNDPQLAKAQSYIAELTKQLEVPERKPRRRPR